MFFFFLYTLKYKTLNPDAITSFQKSIKPLWYLRELLIYPPVNDMLKLYLFFFFLNNGCVFLSLSKHSSRVTPGGGDDLRIFEAKEQLPRIRAMVLQWAEEPFMSHSTLKVIWGFRVHLTTSNTCYKEKLQLYSTKTYKNKIKFHERDSTTNAEVKCWFSRLEECAWLLARKNLPQYNCMTILHCPPGELILCILVL